MNSRNLGQFFRDYLTFFLLLMLLRGTDLYITYQITPDLSQELNPLVTHLNLSWPGFIGMQFLMVLVALLGYHRYAQRTRNPVDKTGLSPFRFIYYYINGHEMSFRKITLSFVQLTNKHYLKEGGAFIGFVLALGFVLVSFFAIFHNMLILHEYHFYLEFLRDNQHLYLPFVFTFLVATSSVVFFTKEYKHYKMMTAEL